MSFKPKSYKEALESFHPLKRKRMPRHAATASVSPRSGRTASGSRKAISAQPEPAQRKQSTLKRHPRPTKTVDGDSAKAIKAEMDELVRQILRLTEEYCFVCGAPWAHADLHPGHYVTRKVLALRWDMRAVHFQCDTCNSEHNERPQYYRSMLALEYGEPLVADLDRIGRENPRLEYSDLITIRDGLRAELKGMK